MIQLPGAGSVPPMVSSQPETQYDLSGLGRVLLRRARPMLAIFVGFVGLVLVLSLVLPKTYTTTVKMIAGNPGTTGFAGSGNTSDDTQVPVLNALLIATGMQSTETYVELFQEVPVAQQVIAQLGLHVSPHDLLSHVAVATNRQYVDHCGFGKLEGSVIRPPPSRTLLAMP